MVRIMMITLLAIAILVTSALLVLGNLRSVIQDTVSTVSAGAQRARDSGVFFQRLAFLGLWIMIFALSYF